jgi:hypothetical protein
MHDLDVALQAAVGDQYAVDDPGFGCSTTVRPNVFSCATLDAASNNLIWLVTISSGQWRAKWSGSGDYLQNPPHYPEVLAGTY